jgi:SWI/SNF-related matrix-associated actin-dependent regulator 1 of chromatin subfamily A
VNELLHDILEEKEKIVVFAHHHDVIDQIYEEFKDISVKMTGETKLDDRQTAIEQFQKNPNVKLFIGSTQAAGLGITLTAADHIVFAELDWVPANITQAEDRLHRIGQKNIVTVQHLVLEGSIDAYMAKKVVEKQEVIEKALDTTENKLEMLKESLW